MIKTIKHAPENVAAFTATGKVTKEDFNIVFSRVREVISEFGELNYLLNLKTDAGNFTSGAWLKDMLLGIKHISKWRRCAIVSDSKVIDKLTELMDTFSIADFKVFKHEDYDRAMHWVSCKKSKHSFGGNLGTALLAGFGGAIALNVLHETIRTNCTNVPAVNEVGEEALDKVLSHNDINLNEKQLYGATLAADVVSNGLYYAALATNKAGILSGVLGGLGAVELPKYLGLDDAPVASTKRKRVMTIAYYTIGAAVTGLIYSKLKKK